MMTLVLIGALVALAVGHVWLVDRKDKRHAAQIDRLLLAQVDRDVLRVTPDYDGPLYKNTGDVDPLPEQAED